MQRSAVSAAHHLRWCLVVVLAAAVAVGCRNGSNRDRADADSGASLAGRVAAVARGPVRVVDDGGRAVTLARPAARVVSLIPSATETLIALGATDRIVGRTRYDDTPQVAAVPSVGGGTDPSIESIVSLRPDLVVAWERDRRRELASTLGELGIPVFTLRTEDTTDILRGIRNLGRLTGRDSAATALVTRLRAELDAVRASVANRPRLDVLYVVFNDPPMTAGPRTFVAQLVGVAGGRSVFDDVKQLWPTVSMEEIVRRDPDLVVLPVGDSAHDAVAALRERAGWRNVGAVRAGRVVTVPANLVNRPGPNVGAAARALRDAFAAARVSVARP